MNEIRKNREKETIICEAKFKIPAILKIMFAIAFVPFCIIEIGMTIISVIFEIELGIYPFLLLLLIVEFVLFICLFSSIKKNVCKVTNKRIYGVASAFLFKRAYSYRLDEINSVEISSALGVNSLRLLFSQGCNNMVSTVNCSKKGTASNGAGIFVISCLANQDELYGRLSELLCEIKNDNDTQIDIEQEKIDLENKKITAFENFVKKSGDKQISDTSEIDYIRQLKELKSLLDSGIITQAEFDMKKKEILKIKEWE